MKKSILLPCSVALFLLALPVHAANVTWTGGNFTWDQPDADSFGLDTYNSGDDVFFGNNGITDGTTGKTAIVLSGTLTPGSVTMQHTQARFLNGASSLPGGGFNYLL
jgi:hypothetical protein